MIDKESLIRSEGLKDRRYGLARVLPDVLRQCERLETRADIVRRGAPYFQREKNMERREVKRKIPFHSTEENSSFR